MAFRRRLGRRYSISVLLIALVLVSAFGWLWSVLGHGRAAGTRAATKPAVTGAMGSSGQPVSLSDDPLGVNTALGHYIHAADTSASGGLDVIQPLLVAAGINLMRFGDGSRADFYDWQTNTDIQNCLPDNPTASFTGSCATSDSLDFSQFSRQARAIGADSFVTVNYGSGTPALAAKWVTKAKTTSGEGVKLWEVGDENYGCWEVNNELAGPPENFAGYMPNENPTCPQTTQGNAQGTQTLATSYAVNALKFLRAMKEADSSARIGVPWAFGSGVDGAAVPDNDEWNNTVLGTDGRYVSFVDAHYYPFEFGGSTGTGGNPTDQQVLRALFQIPALGGQIRRELAKYDPTAGFIVGETGVSNYETTTVCTPTGALFAAGDVLSWLAAGAKSVDWWDTNHYGSTTQSCTGSEFSLFTSSSPPAPEPPYYGYLLASKLARPGAVLGAIKTSDPADVLAYESVAPGGRHVVAFINTNTGSTKRVTYHTFASLGDGTLTTYGYRAGNQNADNPKVVAGITPASSVANRITLPPESMTILETR